MERSLYHLCLRQHNSSSNNLTEPSGLLTSQRQRRINHRIHFIFRILLPVGFLITTSHNHFFFLVKGFIFRYLQQWPLNDWRFFVTTEPRWGLLLGAPADKMSTSLHTKNTCCVSLTEFSAVDGVFQQCLYVFSSFSFCNLTQSSGSSIRTILLLEDWWEDWFPFHACTLNMHIEWGNDIRSSVLGLPTG